MRHDRWLLLVAPMLVWAQGSLYLYRDDWGRNVWSAAGEAASVAACAALLAVVAGRRWRAWKVAAVGLVPAAWLWWAATAFLTDFIGAGGLFLPLLALLGVPVALTVLSAGIVQTRPEPAAMAALTWFPVAAALSLL